MRNFEIKQEEIQKRRNYMIPHPLFLSGRKAQLQTATPTERKTKETGRMVSLFLLRIGNKGRL